jgi:hypothetical protein
MFNKIANYRWKVKRYERESGNIDEFWNSWKRESIGNSGAEMRFLASLLHFSALQVAENVTDQLRKCILNVGHLKKAALLIRVSAVDQSHFQLIDELKSVTKPVLYLIISLFKFPIGRE